MVVTLGRLRLDLDGVVARARQRELDEVVHPRVPSVALHHLAVAVQVCIFGKQTLKTVLSLDGLRVEKSGDFKLSTSCVQRAKPHLGLLEKGNEVPVSIQVLDGPPELVARRFVERDLRVRRTVNTLLLLLGEHRGVAAQVAFESKRI